MWNDTLRGLFLLTPLWQSIPKPVSFYNHMFQSDTLDMIKWQQRLRENWFCKYNCASTISTPTCSHPTSSPMDDCHRFYPWTSITDPLSPLEYGIVLQKPFPKVCITLIRFMHKNHVVRLRKYIVTLSNGISNSSFLGKGCVCDLPLNSSLHP